MAFVLPALPFAQDALEPHMSAQTLGFHHGKHHNAYVTNLNGLIVDTPLAGLSLEEIIRQTSGDPTRMGVFNNAAQVWNHTFFWNGLSPAGGEPTGALLEALNGTFGSVAGFKEQFKQAATTQFGSGWAWLVLDEGKLKITKTGNAELPLTSGQTPLFTCDVWEHAYYLDYQNRRPDFVQTVLDHLVNWNFIASNLAAA
ncbi:superoxide dismutase [Pararhodospirillum oryzae]|uniref:Superoxide dismutase n=1 Tax=Pararhodospirillum oryzae TaxID=478448 RepID=A0A512HBB4_9PROT|nr:superoxide dismutase [Pararhodospirillum oryzae]GEO82746.1 superoxide dismutase [Pararhodospirillum oryzae]